MKKLYLFSFILALALCSHAQTSLAIEGAVSGTPTLYIQNGANVYVEGGININQNGSAASDSNQYLQNNGTLELVSDGIAGQSNFINNVIGLKTYTPGQTTGEVIFAANNETQSITGGGTADFMKLTTNNTLSPTLDLEENVTVDGALTIGGATAEINSTTLTLNGTLAGTGTLTGSSASNLSVTDTGNLGGAITFATGAKTLNNFYINRANAPLKIMLGSDLSVSGALTLANGILNLQGNNLTLTSVGSLAGSPFTSANMIEADGAGQFIRGVNSGAGSYTYPIGDGTPAYSPVTINFVSNANPGTVGINVSPTIHPQMNNPSAALDYLSRYWTFSNTGLSTYSYTGTFSYLPTDIVGTESKLKVSRWANPWYEHQGSSAASNTLTITTALDQTIAPLSSDFTGRYACPYPAITVSPQSAVCTGGTAATLTASGAVTYTWAPSIDLNTTTGAVVTAQISNLTFYTVIGTGSTGCTTTAIVPVATVATGGFISPTSSIICSGGTKALTVTGAAGHDYQWQISSDDITWTDISGATNTVYTTNASDGTTLKYYRLQSQSNACWNVASTSAIVDISNPAITVTTTGITDQTITLNWTPVGSGNYTVSWSGTSAGSSTNATPPKTITSLTPGGTYSITVTQTGIAGCPATGTIASVTTLCGAPTAVTATTPTNNEMIVSWTGGAGNYRVFYRPLYTSNTYYTKDVTGVTSATITKLGNNILPASTTYEVYVTAKDCPTTGIIGQPSSYIYVTTPPALACAAPVIDSVKSTCPIQIEVWMHPGSSPTGNYQIYFQRLTPTVQGVVSYPVSGNYFTVNIGSAGQTYLISASSICSNGSYSNLVIWPGNLTVKPECSTINNLVLSNATCHGFTASWNIDQCLSNNVSYYQIYLREQGTVNWNSYPVTPVPPAPIGPYKLVNWLSKGTIYQVYVRSVYSCNGYNTGGPASQILNDTTLSAGCKDDEQATAPIQPSVQQYSPDKSEVLSIYPNPNNGEFMMDISRTNNNEDKVRIEVINMLGQTVMTDLTNISDGHLNEFIRLPNTTASGNYFVRVTVGNNVYTTKVNISK